MITANTADGKADIAVYDSNVAVGKVNKAIITDAQTLTTGQKAQARANLGTLKIEDSNYAYEVIFNILTQTGFMILPIRQSYVLDISKFDPFKGTLIEEGKGYIYVPDNLVATYKTAWTTYADRIFGLTALTVVPEDMFKGNLLITSYPYKVTSVGQKGFMGCTNLKTIDLSGHADRMWNDAFKNSGLEGDFLNGCPSTGWNVFDGCTGITSMDFPVCNFIRGNTFAGCSSLTKIILRSETVAGSDGINPMTGTPIANGTGFIYVPDALVETYKLTTNWTVYASQIKPISELNE